MSIMLPVLNVSIKQPSHCTAITPRRDPLLLRFPTSDSMASHWLSNLAKIIAGMTYSVCNLVYFYITNETLLSETAEMKAIVQRVARASVSVDGEVISHIGKGICVLLGISRDDTEKDIDFIVRKLLSLRIFEDCNGKRWSKSVKDYNYEILCVSQFTLYCKLKGNKPDFHLAMEPEKSEQLYTEFIQKLKTNYTNELVKDGKFGALMKVLIENDGPVTIELESASQPSQKNAVRRY